MNRHGWRFEIEAMVDPQSLPRVLGYFAQRSIVPDTLEMHIRDGRMTIGLITADLPEEQAQIIAAKLDQIVLVENVRMHKLAGAACLARRSACSVA